MRARLQSVRILVLLVTGLLSASSAVSPAFADTIRFKNRNELKGLIVEKHADRVIISTEKGELPVMLKDIEDIDYDDPAQSFYDLGKKSEAENHYAVALAYYEKALEINPNHEEAKRAANGMKNRFWASNNERPMSEIEKQQSIQDAWSTGRSIKEVTKKHTVEQSTTLKTGLGVTLEKKGDWVRLSNVDSRKPAAAAGLMKNDRLVSIDGDSLRYLNEHAVSEKLLVPRMTNFTLEFERDCYVRLPEGGSSTLKALGFKLKLEYQGLIVHPLVKDSPADRAGLKEGDLVVKIGSAATRYMPIQKVVELIEHSDEEGVPITIRRSALLTRV